MKHLKSLGLGLAVAAALMAFIGASTASATILEKEGGAHMIVGEEIHAVIDPGTKAELEAGFITVVCEESTVRGVIEKAGGATATAWGRTSAVTFSKCNCEPIEVTNGTLEIHNISGTANGTLTASGFTAKVPCNTIFGKVTCYYKTGENKHLGTLTGSATTGSTPTADIATILIRDAESSALCGETATWLAKYIVTTPDVLNVTAS